LIYLKTNYNCTTSSAGNVLCWSTDRACSTICYDPAHYVCYANKIYLIGTQPTGPIPGTIYTDYDTFINVLSQGSYYVDILPTNPDNDSYQSIQGPIISSGNGFYSFFSAPLVADVFSSCGFFGNDLNEFGPNYESPIQIDISAGPLLPNAIGGYFYYVNQGCYALDASQVGLTPVILQINGNSYTFNGTIDSYWGIYLGEPIESVYFEYTDLETEDTYFDTISNWTMGYIPGASKKR